MKPLIVVAGFGSPGSDPEPVYCGCDQSAADKAVAGAVASGRFGAVRSGYIVAWDRAPVRVTPSLPAANAPEPAVVEPAPQPQATIIKKGKRFL